jgi:DNA modification methylase
VSDPPYGLSFMGKGWDHGVPGVEFWTEAARVAKPGAHLLAFGGTRTYHRLTCAIEDAGWEIRDCVMWVYGSGFPKSHDVSKAIDKAAGAEREVVGFSQHKSARIEQGGRHQHTTANLAVGRRKHAPPPPPTRPASGPAGAPR